MPNLCKNVKKDKMIIPILIAVICGSVLLIVLMAVASKKDNAGENSNSKKKHHKSESTVIKECMKKLSHDPHNIPALTTLGEVYWSSDNYEKACPIYATLYGLISMHVEIDQKKASLRHGVCSFKMNKSEDAYRGLTSALKIDPKIFEGNLYLGELMYQKKEYEKAVLCLKRALATNPESSETMKFLAYSMYQAKKYRESLPYLKKVVETNPENKEALFFMASAMEEAGMGDRALKIFMHLRPDPVFGPQACISSGSYHDKLKQYEKAVQDYEIALKLEGIPAETKLSIYYKLSQSYLAMHNISKALYYLKQIQMITPSYKDVNALVQRYQELNQNSNLQAYLMSGTSEFVSLCRKFVSCYYTDSFVKVEDISVAAESIEVLCEVESSKWQDTELFRFFRSTGAIGELYIRDFHSKLRDMKCERGFCVTAGSFTEEAKKYVEGRPIDLIEKNKLISVLKRIDSIH